ncbi:MAG: hypothetical protein ACETWR_25045 [Anaerolineae bacterium]
MFIKHYFALNPLRRQMLPALGLAVVLTPDAVTAVNQVGEDSVTLIHFFQALPENGQVDVMSWSEATFQIIPQKPHFVTQNRLVGMLYI